MPSDSRSASDSPLPALPADVQDGLAARLDAIAANGAALEAAENLARRLQAGGEAGLDIGTKSNPMDLVTRADRECEALLKDFVRTRFPDDAIIAEEGGAEAGAADSRIRWAIDPIDGTVNYANGMPLYSISLGLLYDGEPAAGLVSLPALQRRYRAVRGRGATLNGTPLRVRRAASIKQGLVVTGFPYEREAVLDELTAGVRSMLQNAQGLRRTGSAALDLCWTAEGIFVAHYEFGLKIWDVAAGVAILREAGGRVTNFRGADYRVGMFQMAASNGEAHASFLDALQPLAHVESFGKLDALAESAIAEHKQGKSSEL